MRMTIRQAPPGRRSISQTERLEPSQPHQWRTCSGRVHASKSRWGGRSKNRVKQISRSEGRVTATSVFAFASMFLCLLGVQFGKVIVETVHASFPEPAVILYPIGNLP